MSLVSLGDLPMDINWQTIRPRRLEGAAATGDRLEAAIESSKPLSDFLAAAGEQSDILLIVNDPYRATQTQPALRAMAARLRTLRLNPRFKVLVATGTHVVEPVARKEFENRIFSGCDLAIDSVAWHESTNAATLVDIGGIRLNKLIAESRFILAIGSVEPHYFAGVTGAHKTLTIGCMGHADIEANHCTALSPDSRILRTHGNPVFDGVARALSVLTAAGKQLCAINEVASEDVVVAAAVGDPLQTLDDLMPAMRQCFVYKIEAPVDVLHLRVPSPLGRNLYQADKALKNHGGAVRAGGGIVLEASCEEGVGPRRFVELLRAAGTYAESCERVSRDGYKLGDHKAVKLRHLTDPACHGVHVVVASSVLRSDELAGTGLHVVPDVPQALDWLSGCMALAPRQGLIVEDAGNLCVGL